MIELQASVKTSKHDDTTRTRTPKPGYLKGLVSGSCIAGFCYCLHFTQIQQIAIKIPCLARF